MCVDANEISKRKGRAEDVDVGNRGEEEPVMFASAVAAWESGVRDCMKAISLAIRMRLAVSTEA